MVDRDKPIMWLSLDNPHTVCVSPTGQQLLRLSWDEFVDNSLKDMPEHMCLEWAVKLREFSDKLNQHTQREAE